MKYHSVVSAGQLLCTLAAALLASSSVDAFSINPSLAKRPTSGVSLWAKGNVKRYEIQDLPEDFGNVTGVIPTRDPQLGYLSNSKDLTVKFEFKDGKIRKSPFFPITSREGLNEFDSLIEGNFATLHVPKRMLYFFQSKGSERLTGFESYSLKIPGRPDGVPDDRKFFTTEEFPDYPFETVDAAFIDGTIAYFFSGDEYAEYSIWEGVNRRKKKV